MGRCPKWRRRREWLAERYSRGAGLWLVADETMVPALGFSRPPGEYPASTHVYAFTSHIVFGLALEGARRAIRSILD